MELTTKIIEKIQSINPELHAETVEFRGETTIVLPKRFIRPVCQLLKNDSELEFIRLDDVTAIDWAQRTSRFQVIYNLYSFKNSSRIRLAAVVEESDCSIDTVSDIWRSANWYERETFDMYGITFTNHPDHRRMYMPEEFEYHPLRKDFPLMGIPGSIPLPKK
ncbi:MAG: NADH-quinone oxidoreductase subunit C [Ignavibacteria bacterium]|nr:NADH-quinone oxidoreductase subunit C [Ignavibacteria bacterium]